MISRSVHHDRASGLEPRERRRSDNRQRARVPATPFDEFFALNVARIVRLAHLLTGNDAAAEDLAQDAFARVHPRFAELDNPAGYLHIVTVNVCRQWHKRRFREERTIEKSGDVPVSEESAYEPVLDAIDALPYRQRAVVVLRYWLGLSEHQIAEALDCRPGTVRSLHSRALAALRKDLPR